MLILSRRKDESILIGDDVRVTVLDIKEGRVRIGIEANRGKTILREELTFRTVGEGEVAL